MSRKEQIHHIFDAMAEAFCSVRVHRIATFKKLGLGRPQFLALRILAHHKEPMSIKELAQKLNVTSGAVSQLSDPLVEKKLVTRREDAADRRTVRLKLTDAAKDIFKQLRGAHLEAIKSMFADLSEKELTNLENLLKKLKLEQIDDCFNEPQKAAQ